MSLDRSALPGPEQAGAEMHELMRELFPFCRSLTGDGVRQTFEAIERDVPLERTEVPSGTQVYDWTLPREWNIRGATLTGPGGEPIADFADSNLHVLGYSVPVNGTFSLEELRPHLFTDPERPDVIPYRTSYHNENWGFCLPHSRYEQLAEGDYQAVIDSTPRGRARRLRRALLARRERGRGARLDLRLPPLARQRQPLGRRARGHAGEAPRRPEPAPLVPLPLRARPRSGR